MNNLTKVKRTQNNLLSVAWLSVMAIGSVTVAHADIYKVTKPDGQVVYTDVPPVGQAGEGMRIEVVPEPNRNTNQMPNQPTSQPQGTAQQTTGSDIATNARDVSLASINNTLNSAYATNANIDYALNIVTPSDERAYRKPAQSIDVSVNVSPRLQAGDTVSILVDGVEMSTGSTASIPTDTLNPGEHTLSVQVRRADGSTSGSDSMTIYVIQNTQTLQRKVRFEEQMRAYQQLPWHQKMLMRLRGEKPVLNLDSNTSDAFRP